ncbi:MAG TPA: Trp biosynthesis-associated membrane protein [Microbacterium sp.]|nr:Trp biosynthesis-associated membrane protein [Microbacterium sp.]
MTRRARLVGVLAAVAVGAIGVISSTQTWLVAVLDEDAQRELAVAGAAAVPVLAPLSLAVLALGAALSIVGLLLRYVFGGLMVVIAGILGYLSAQVAFTAPVAAVASTVTSATGITGTDAVAALVSSVTPTPWPAATLASCAVLLASGLWVLATARRWVFSGRRFKPNAAAASRPVDAVDSWDDLSHGEDPTARPR